MSKPSIGRIVHYTLTEQDAACINKRREDARYTDVARGATGVVIHAGNPVKAGDVYPLVITRLWGDSETSSVNGQVLLDGNDTLWVTSVAVGEGERHFAWPTRTDKAES